MVRRKTRASRSAGAWAWALLLCSSAAYFFLANDADNDLWGHVFFGRHILAAGGAPHTDPYAYTTAGATWVDHEWLTQAGMAVLFDRLGNPGLLLFKFLAGVATFALVLHGVRQRTPVAWQWGGIGLLVAAVLARGFACRPQIVTYVAVAALLVLLRQAGSRHRAWLWAVPPLFALWANAHGGFVLGLVVLGMATAAATWQRRPEARQLGLVLGLAVAATAVNPYGPGLLVYVAKELRMPHPITEWQAPALTEVEHGAFFALLGLFVVTLPFQRLASRPREHGTRTTAHGRGPTDSGIQSVLRAPGSVFPSIFGRAFDWEVLLAIGVAAMALQHQRHTPLLAICAAAPLATQLRRASVWARHHGVTGLGIGATRALGGAVVALAVLQLGLTAARLRRDGLNIVYDPADYPVRAVAAMRAAGMTANLAVPLEWGEYVLYFLSPRVKVSLDGRFATLFPESVIAENFDFFAGAAGWQRLLDAYPTDAVLLPADASCPIDTLPGWRRILTDGTASVYVRGPAPAPLQSPAAPATSGIFP